MTPSTLPLLSPPSDAASPARLVSLDQFRGYTVLGMFFVNFCGSFAAIAAAAPIFKHHNTYCSYADTIMPQFFFAVGFAYRLTLLRRLSAIGPWTAYLRVLRRNAALILVGFVVYGLDGGVENWTELQSLGWSGFVATAFQRNLFQTLVHIGVTAIWIMPVIAARPAVRLGFALFSAVLHVALSHAFFYEWVMKRPGIDGGILGFLTWTAPMIAGSLAYDVVSRHGARGSAGRLLLCSAALMLLGYALSCLNLVAQGVASPEAGLRSYLLEPPFVSPSRPVNYWTMSQRAGSISYLVFGAGFSMTLYALCVLLCDRWSFRLSLLQTFGQNALAAYILHDLVNSAITPYVPRDAPLWYVLCGFGLSLAICYIFVRYLESRRLYVRL